MKRKTPAISHVAIAVFLALTAVVLAVESHTKFLNLFNTTAEAAPAFVDQSFVRKLNVQANDLVVDPTTQTIYASLPSANGSNGNSIAPIDPNSGALGTPVFIGSEPNKMAISDNGEFIYVALTGGFAIRRFDVATQTAGPQFSLGSVQFDGPIQAGELAVQTSNPHTLAVYRQTVGSVAIFDDGVQRTNTAAAPFNASVVFSTTDLNRLYALNQNSLDRLTVTANGVSSVTPQTITGTGAAKLSGGKLYTSSGHAIDPETGNLLGTFTGLGSSSTTAFVPDSNVKRMFFLTAPFSSGGPVTVTLRVYDQQTFIPLGTLDIPNVLGTPTEMVRWGTNGLAFCTTGGNVVLIQTTLVSDQDVVPTATPTPTPTPTPSPTPTPTPNPGELRQVTLTANDLAAANGATTIFASVPSSAGLNGNSVTPIDAVGGTAGNSVFIGSEPNKLALSTDGGTLWVALDGANGVRKFDVASRTPGLQFSLGSDPFFGPFRAEDMAVAPGQPDVLAVSRLRVGVSPRHGGVAVFDNGVQRTLTTPDHTGSNVIEFSQSPEILYGQNTETTEFGFRKMAVAPCGCITVATTQNLLGTGFGSDFRADNGRVYSVSGRVVDPEARTIQGTFILRDPNSFGFNATLVAPDSKAGRVYFLLDDNGSTILRVFDIKTFLKIGELQLPGVTGTVSSLIRWGTNGLAFRTSTQVFLLQNALIGGQDPNFVAAPLPPSPTMTSMVQVSAFNGDASGVTIGVTGSLTTSGSTNANGVFQINGIPPCGSYTVTPTKTNYQFSPPSITVTNPATSSLINFSAIRKTIGFSTATASQLELQNRIFIAVTRNTTTEPASVTYRTISGTASDRSDFNATFGKLDFAVNESIKTIAILLTDDVLVEGPEQFTVQLENPSGAEFAQGGSTITITINDNDIAASTVNPLSNAQFFVRQHYQDFLNRAAADDPTGLDFWTNEIASCNNIADPAQKSACFAVKRINVSGAFFLSIEFQETGYFVHRLYTSSFAASVARPRGLPRFAEFMTDTQQIGAGVVVGAPGWEQKLAQNKQNFVASWVARPEFLAAHPLSQTADQFVDSLFQNNGVTPTAAERAAAITLFGVGDAAGRAAALRSVAESKSVNQKQFNPAFVLMQYFGYLRRNPDDAPDNNFDGYQFWLDKLNQFNGNFVDAEMVKAFLSSLEYQQRFGPTTFDLSQ